MSSKRVMIFVDGSNIWHSMERFQAGYKVDYFKLVSELKEDRDLIRTYYYASSKVPPVQSQTDFYERLMDGGFRVVTKPLKGHGHDKKEKGVDVALVTDFLSLGYKKAYDVGIIVSGDQDYVEAIKKVQDLGITVEVAAFANSVGKELFRCCDKKIYLDSIANKIKK